ncbi:nuclear protein 96-domain-containing protein [Bisporella sp. PMI_857]|nr:nuclear protein 96-domain-containing protein [Bisporella sp. PMI_857]
MSGFGFGGGFGQNNNQTQNTFGGFGANNTNATSGGFGTSGTTPFGQSNTNTGGSIFGGGGGTTGGFGGGFGTPASTGAFGAAKPSPFGSTATTSGGGLFGNNTATAGSGGFGSGGFGTAATNTTSAFGGGNTGGGLFGGNKTGFGTSSSTPAFGGGTSAFGGGTTSAFGAPASTALGGNVGECQGTASTAFAPFIEKEPNSTSNQQNSFQSISFMDPYKKFSPEELRLADYAQGRRYGNQSNQPGAFGATNFGGSSFGSNNQATGGFGQTQPASTGLFGGTSGGFGSTQQTNNAFGASSTPASTGLFGAAKPATGLFGASAQPTTGGNLFGGGSAFGGSTTGGFGTQNQQNAGSSLFGGNNNATANKPPVFGAAQQQPAANNPFGGSAGFGATAQQPANSLFGNAAQKPATGLFGQQPAATTNTGLFGSTSNVASTNPFGASATNQPSTGLFGAAKPATSGTNLFGGAGTTANTGTGLFGGGGFGGQNQNQQQQQQSTGLFGGLGNNNQQKPGLFGATPQQQTGVGLFGGQSTQQPGLFGANNTIQQQQQPQNTLFGANSSLLGTSQQNQQAPQTFTASISDPGAYGNNSLFASLMTAENKNPGPLATPLSRSATKKPAAVPIYKLNPATSSRFSTPAKSRGFGFSYSTYGSPGSATSTASTPGNLNTSLLGGSISRGLSKSMSTSSLRRNFSTEDSILAPSAFSSSPSARHYGSTGSIKKLVINRGLRNDLFSPPQQSQPQPTTPNNGGILKKRDLLTLAPSLRAQELGYLRPSASTNGAGPSGSTNSPEMEQVRGNELAIVHEEDNTAPSNLPTKLTSNPLSQDDHEPGEYWMKPTLAEIENMDRSQRKAVVGFTVGREGVGQVTFKEPVDFTKSKKPPMGQGLNVPSRISLMNSWPRNSSSRTDKNGAGSSRLKKHVARLQKVPNTTFESYDENTGTWSFSVEHFTTYGLDYDEDESEDEFGQSTLSAPPDTPTPKSRTPKAHAFEDSFTSTSQVTESEPEDTFDFRHKKKALPGAFDDQELFYDDEEMDTPYEEDTQEESFLDERSDNEMAGSFPQIGDTAELEYDDSHGEEDMDVVTEIPGGSTIARLRALKEGTPVKRKFTAVQRSRNRALLKSLIDFHGNDSRLGADPIPVPRARVVSDGRGFATSIDLMNSLFSQTGSPTKKLQKAPAQAKGIRADGNTDMSNSDRAFHDSMKPSWGPDGILVYAAPSGTKPLGRSSRALRNGLLEDSKAVVVSEGRDIVTTRFSNEAAANAIKKQIDVTVIDECDGIPFACLPEGLCLFDFIDDQTTPSHEKLVWQLASVLWDEIDIPATLESVPQIVDRLRKEKLSAFWEKLVDSHRIADACGHLLAGKNFHLATLVALVGGSKSTKQDIREQLDNWQTTRFTSEISLPIRAIYELLSGNVCRCEGTKAMIEDRVDGFTISEEFGLDWRQAFGLRLWYTLDAEDEIKDAVHGFAKDLANNVESVTPQPWYVEQNQTTFWNDPDLEYREDLLWGLLKLYTYDDSDLEAIIRPENSQLSPLNARLTWQLSQALPAFGKGYHEDAEDKSDQITLTFASQLINEGSWLEAVFVLLHLTDGTARAKAIQTHLARHASRIGPEDSPSFVKLIQDFHIPATWIWEAKALFLRSVKKDPKGEVDSLLKAGLFEEAHRTFTKEVAPKTVIERDYDTLRSLLRRFENKENAISEWHLGGEIYADFLDLLNSLRLGHSTDSLVLQRLLASLPAVIQESRHPDFMETVAIEIISAEVAKAVVTMGKYGEVSTLDSPIQITLN